MNALATDADILEGAAYDDGFSDTADADDDFADNGISVKWHFHALGEVEWGCCLPEKRFWADQDFPFYS